MRNKDLSWGKMQQKTSEDIKMNYALTHLYSYIVYKKKQQFLRTSLLLSVTLNIIWRCSFARWTSSHILINKFDSSGAKLLEHRAEIKKIEPIPSWKTIYPTDGPQTTQIFLCTRRGNAEVDSF